MKTIYVLHEFGCPSHVNALRYLASQKKVKICFCEFDLLEQLRKRPFSFRRFLHNIFYLFFLIFVSSRKIVLGIAPVNPALKLLLKLYNQHELFYHTSYTSWDFKTLAHQPNCAQDFKTWNFFITNKAKHIFAVSEKTKKELCANFQINPSKISIVNHSYKQEIQTSSTLPQRNTYICVGELSYRKGINELLDIFSAHPELSLTLVGKGNLQNKVKEFSQKFRNIHYKGNISNWNNLENNYKKNSFLILNSHKTDQWEELFGMVLIEGMACGCIPLATNHSGPMEVITDGNDGLLCKEGEIETIIKKAQLLSLNTLTAMRKAAIRTGAQYSAKNKSFSWEPIFK